MTIKTILLPRDQAEITGEVLAVGLAVARQFNAHIELLLLRRDPDDAVPFVFGTLSSDRLRKTVVDAAQREENERAVAIRQKFDEFCTKHGIPIVDAAAEAPDTVTASWQEREQDALVQRGRLHDLIIVARPEGKATPQLLETVLLETTRPILVAPPKALPSIGERIVIGWNSSAEAAQAVASALPFLVRAKAVTILTASKRLQNSNELVEYLRWHGIKAEVKVFQQPGRSVGATLLAEAKSLAADLLVIGGYSHTRARQLLFGGVTQHFIANADLPVLMAH